MATYRVQVGFQLDSALPRDLVTMNPHYSGDNPQALADAIKANLIANSAVAMLVPFTLKVYDALKAPPSYPLYSTSNGAGFTPSNRPREVSLCLSYYALWNRPTFRGRLYIPAYFLPSSMDVRPTGAQMAAAIAWKTTFGKNLPANHTWGVFSRKTGQLSAISHVWCDDEWDTIRSRGMRGTTRVTETLAA